MAKELQRHGLTPDTKLDKTSDLMIAAGAGALIVPVAAMLLPFIGTVILSILLIVAGVGLGVVGATRKH